MVKGQVCKGAATKMQDTLDAKMSLCDTQGIVSEAHVTQKDVIARGC